MAMYIPTEKVDDFVVSKGAYIRSAQRKFREMAQYAPQPKKYVSGETFYLLGRGVRLKVEKNVQDAISSDGIYLHLRVKDTEDFKKKQKMVSRYLDPSMQRGTQSWARNRPGEEALGKGALFRHSRDAKAGRTR